MTDITNGDAGAQTRRVDQRELLGLSVAEVRNIVDTQASRAHRFNRWGPAWLAP